MVRGSRAHSVGIRAAKMRRCLLTMRLITVASCFNKLMRCSKDRSEGFVATSLSWMVLVRLSVEGRLQVREEIVIPTHSSTLSRSYRDSETSPSYLAKASSSAVIRPPWAIPPLWPVDHR